MRFRTVVCVRLIAALELYAFQAERCGTFSKKSPGIAAGA